MTTGTNSTAAAIIARLEEVTGEVIAVISRNDTENLLPLGAEQCTLAKSLDDFPKESLDRKRLQVLHSSIATQQALIDQAASVTEFFLKSLYQEHEHHFSRLG